MRHREDCRERLGHLLLHPEEAKPALGRETLPSTGVVCKLDFPVNRNWVVKGREQWPTLLHQLEHSGAQALVVVNEVELASASFEYFNNSLGIGVGLAESCRTHDGELRNVVLCLEFSDVGHAEWIWVSVEIKSWNWSKTNTLIELRIWLTSKDLNTVTECNEFTSEVAGVNTLSPAGRIATVDQERNAKSSSLGWSWHDSRWHRNAL